ncbi:MAG: hypothetical protein QG614_146 [Patescibacteria group bacterium]|nr:hypothetical protein [Patescibacteria group bacterium]
MNNIKGTTFVFLTILLVALWSSSPYLKIFILALLLSLVFQPIFNKINNKLKREGVTTFLTTIIFLLILILPTGIFLNAVVNQIQDISNNYQNVDISNVYVDQTEHLKAFLNKTIGIENTQNLLNSANTTITNFVKNTIIPFSSQTFSVFINLFLFIFMFILVLPNAKKIMDKFKSVLPMNSNDAESFSHKLTNSTSLVFSSLIISALVQAAATGLILFVFDVPAAVLLTLAAFFLSFFPFGSGILTFPIAIAYILSGNIITGVVILVWQVVVVSNIDNLVKIKLFSGKDVNIPGWLTFLSTLGGIATFGFWGVIFGPLIAVSLLTITDIYLKDKKTELN